MAKHKSAEKKRRRDEKKRMRNRSHLKRLRTKIKKFRALLESHEVAPAKKMLAETISLIDRTVSKGIIHKNTGARYKSNLMKGLRQQLEGRAQQH